MHLFPLELVVIQQEEVRLHIFEPRYKKLILDCVKESQTFGIPVVLKSRIQNTGAEMAVVNIEKTYPGGEMDILCRAESRFDVLDFFPSVDLQVAATGIVIPQKFTEDEDKELGMRLYDLLQEFYHLAGVPFPEKWHKEITISEVFHKCGLSLEQEYELAELKSTSARQRFITSHLKEMQPVLSNINRMKKLVELNGHFKKLPQSF